MYNFDLVKLITNPKMHSDALRLSPEIAAEITKITGQRRHIKLFTGKNYRLMLLQVEDESDENINRKIVLHPKTGNQLHLCPARYYGLRIAADRISLGPVIGILAGVKGKGRHLYGTQTTFFQELIDRADILGEICYVFDFNNINWHNKTISGYTYQDHRWIRSTFPWPDVVYPRDNNYSNPRLMLRQQLINSGCVFLNPVAISKWTTHKLMTGNSDLLPFIPDTRRVLDFSQVNNMLNKYGGVYLKPAGGDKGRNIIRISKERGTQYKYSYNLDNRVHKGISNSLAGLRQALWGVMGKRSYIVQKQINLIQSGPRIIDIRVLIQKDQLGTWSITGMAGRIGGKRGITSNIASGGTCKSMPVILEEHFSSPEIRDKIVADISFVSMKTALTLEKSLGPCGEMGLDIGIDKSGQVWFIEANLRPARYIFKLIGEDHTRRQSLEKPLLYARSLAGFKHINPVDNFYCEE